jgi:cobalamin 5'-phosphate synthase/cobalamin synthase
MRRAVAFLTPLGRATVPDATSFMWFPVVGAAIGAVLGLLWWGLARVWPPEVVATVVVVADLGLTGMLHIDGLIDTADGLLPPHADRERRLQVMSDPAAGAFGTTATVAVLLLRWAGLSAIHPSVLLLVGIWAASRTLMAAVALTLPYARTEGGLASAFLAPEGAGTAPAATVRLVVVLSGACLALAGCLLWKPLGGAVTLVAEGAAGAAVVWLAVRRIGGFTGDVLGAAGVVAESVALVVAAARW